MTKQTEAQRLADAIEWDNTHELRVKTAAELRRLDEANRELLEALKRISYAEPDRMDHQLDCEIIQRCAKVARAAIAKHGGNHE